MGECVLPANVLRAGAGLGPRAISETKATDMESNLSPFHLPEHACGPWNKSILEMIIIGLQRLQAVTFMTFILLSGTCGMIAFIPQRGARGRASDFPARGSQ